MDMHNQAQVAFYLSGIRTAGALDAVDGLKLRPALYAAYSDLTRLRYDYPVVLADNATGAPYESLTAIVDRLLQKIAAPGADGERLRKRVLQAEQEIRRLVANGSTGTLLELWDLACTHLLSADAPADPDRAKARAALDVDGEVLDCTARLPRRMLAHAWRMAEDAKARRFHATVDTLVLKLKNILHADHAVSSAGRSAQSLRASMGAPYEEVFDFEAMASLLGHAAPAPGLSESRRRRIEGLLSVLASQPFFSAPREAAREGAGDTYSFEFESCSEAARAFRSRLPRLTELARALAVAELEIAGEYDEARHETLFAGYGSNGLGTEELAQFPDYFVFMNGAAAGDYAECMALLATNVPVKVLAQFDDVLEASPLANRLAFNSRSRQLTDMAIGSSHVYVLQSSASHLVKLRGEVLQGFAYAGPALFSVYSGAAGAAGVADSGATYLRAAAAMQSRAFPALVYDPSAGSDWASRFSLAGNTQPDREYPVSYFAYEDRDHQRMGEELEFTLADFVACDPRYASHFARIPPQAVNGNLITVRQSMSRAVQTLPEQVPHVLMVDENDVLQRVLVDEQLVQEARRCSEAWRSLQELGGIRNSHAERALALAKAAWEEEKRREIEALRRENAPAVAATSPPGQSAPPAEASAVQAAAPAPAEAAPEASTDEPYVETPRCTTCEECVQINNKMFVYDGNKQAYIANADAGTYRQLVEAAESCQVSIIHPGKPRNPAEPGLDELLERAQPFL